MGPLRGKRWPYVARILSYATRKKIAMEKGWNENSPNLAAVIAHVRGGGLVGVVPWSLHLAVVDVDKGAEEAVAAVNKLVGAPVASTESQREGGAPSLVPLRRREEGREVGMRRGWRRRAQRSWLRDLVGRDEGRGGPGG